MEAVAAEPAVPDDLPPYERARLAQIAQNQAKLAELGLLNAQSRQPSRSRSAPAPKRPRTAAAQRVPAVPVRRSARGLDAKAAEEVRREEEEAAAAAGLADSSPGKKQAARERGEPSVSGLSGSVCIEREDPTVGSSRSQQALLDALERLGVGNEVPGPPTKASVMEFASNGPCPKFSKYVARRHRRAPPRRGSASDL
jgi:hypothetical protein